MDWAYLDLRIFSDYRNAVNSPLFAVYPVDDSLTIQHIATDLAFERAEYFLRHKSLNIKAISLLTVVDDSSLR